YMLWRKKITNEIAYQTLRYFLRRIPAKKNVLILAGSDHRWIFEEHPIPDAAVLSDEEIETLLINRRAAYERLARVQHRSVFAIPESLRPAIARSELRAVTIEKMIEKIEKAQLGNLWVKLS